MALINTAMNVSPEQRIAMAKAQIIEHEAAAGWNAVVMVGEDRVVDDVATACTDGYLTLYGREFIGGLNDAQLRYLVCHENGHELGQHMFAYKHLTKLNPMLANMAMDFWDNLFIEDTFRDYPGFVERPCEGLCIDEKYRGWSVPEIFYDLYEQGDGDGEGDGEGDGDGDDGDDGQGGGGGGSSTDDGQPVPLDDHNFDGRTPDEEEEIKRKINDAIRQGKFVASKVSGQAGELDFDELTLPKINYREVMRDFTRSTMRGNDTRTFSRPNRRYQAHKIYLPSGISERVGPLVLAVDTSASMWMDNVFTRCMSEVAGICKEVKPERVSIAYWDTKVWPLEHYEPADYDNIAKTAKPLGGGGTTVAVVPEYLRKHKVKPQAVVVFTDGDIYDGDWGNWDCPVLWVVINNKDAHPTVGKVVHVTDADIML